MEAIKFRIKGNWAQFRKAETNNNPLSHDFITKTALIGMIGAVLGIERYNMKSLYPVLSEGLLYSVQINNEVKKQSWGFTLRSINHIWDKAPKQMEFIRNADYTIILALKDPKCKDYFWDFANYCKNNKACFTPVLGLHNCPAEIQFLDEGEITENKGTFETSGFVIEDYKPEVIEKEVFRIGFDNIPTYQNNDFWNLPEKFKKVFYPSNQSKIRTKGTYFEFKNESRWCMI